MRSIAFAAAAVLALSAGAQASDQAAPSPADDPRVIGLEMVGVGRFLLDGEEVRELEVVPGETVVFRVDNTSGQELGFEVGNHDRICDPSRTPRWSIPAWTEGTRELTWEVPAGAGARRWGHRGRYCQLGEFSVGNESAEDRMPPLPTVTGPLNVHLGHSEMRISFEADFEGTTSAVVWQTSGDPWRALHLSRSDDVTFGDFATEHVANDIDDRTVAVCGADVVVGYLQRAPDEDRRLWLARLPGDGSPASRVEVRAPVGGGGDIDVACTDDRVYVAWSERVDGQWHPYVRSATLPALELSTIHDAGPAKRDGVAVAATDSHGLLAWKEGQRIRLAHLQVGTADGGRLLPVAVRTVAARGRGPILDADGAHVALGFDRGTRAVVATSRDGGVRFDQRRRFDRRTLQGTPWEFDSLAVDGNDVVATLVVYYGGDAWDRQRLRSRDRGKTWTTRRIGDPVAAIPDDGLLVTPEGVKVAEAYTDGEYADEFDLRVRREE